MMHLDYDSTILAATRKSGRHSCLTILQQMPVERKEKVKRNACRKNEWLRKNYLWSQTGSTSGPSAKK